MKHIDRAVPELFFVFVCVWVGLHLTLKLRYVTFYVFAKMKDIDRAIPELLCVCWLGAEGYFLL